MKTHFKVGVQYDTTSTNGVKATVEAIVGGRILAKTTGGYYTLHTLDGKCHGHFWNDAKTQGFYHHNRDSYEGYDLVAPVVIKLQRYGKNLVSKDGDALLNKIYVKKDFEAEKDVAVVRVIVDDKVTIYSLAEFLLTDIYKGLR